MLKRIAKYSPLERAGHAERVLNGLAKLLNLPPNSIKIARVIVRPEHADAAERAFERLDDTDVEIRLFQHGKARKHS